VNPELAGHRRWSMTDTDFEVILPDDKKMYRVVHKDRRNIWSKRRFRNLTAAAIYAGMCHLKGEFA
jgi:hypothetical protein